jgi:hypothetical protein
VLTADQQHIDATWGLNDGKGTYARGTTAGWETDAGKERLKAGDHTWQLPAWHSRRELRDCVNAYDTGRTVVSVYPRGVFVTHPVSGCRYAVESSGG